MCVRERERERERERRGGRGGERERDRKRKGGSSLERGRKGETDYESKSVACTRQERNRLRVKEAASSAFRVYGGAVKLAGLSGFFGFVLQVF